MANRIISKYQSGRSFYAQVILDFGQYEEQRELKIMTNVMPTNAQFLSLAGEVRAILAASRQEQIDAELARQTKRELNNESIAAMTLARFSNLLAARLEAIPALRTKLVGDTFLVEDR